MRAGVAMSIQDQGRYGHRAQGYSRSGAMDGLSLAYLNQVLGNEIWAAGIEVGPSPFSFEVVESCVVALGGAERVGFAMWEPVELQAGTVIDVKAPPTGVWTYLAMSGGVDGPLVLGSRSSCVSDGIGSWIRPGDVIGIAPSDAVAPDHYYVQPVDEPPAMRGRVRVFGNIEGFWAVGRNVGRMGYQLVGSAPLVGSGEERSEPLLPGCIQALPSGQPIVLMAECPTIGGYGVPAVVHSEDLRLVAQTTVGEAIDLEVVA